MYYEREDDYKDPDLTEDNELNCSTQDLYYLKKKEQRKKNRKTKFFALILGFFFIILSAFCYFTLHSKASDNGVYYEGSAVLSPLPVESIAPVEVVTPVPSQEPIEAKKSDNKSDSLLSTETISVSSAVSPPVCILEPETVPEDTAFSVKASVSDSNSEVRPTKPTIESAPSSALSNDTTEESSSIVASSYDSLSDGITVYFLDVGQGDSAVIICGNHAMMIDGGGSDKSDYIYSFIQRHDIDHFDYIVATHPASDHIGGLSAALQYASTDNIFCNYTYYDSTTFNNMKKYAAAQGVNVEVPAIGDSFPLGSANITVLGPYYHENNSSVVLKVVYGDVSFLFTGDSESNEELALIQHGTDLGSTVLKVGHHGSNTSTTQSFLDAVSPTYAVISVGGDNSYGHPDREVLDRLHNISAEVFRTDMHGIITMSSDDGKTIRVETEDEVEVSAFAVEGGYDAYLLNLKAEQEKNEEESKLAEGAQRNTYTQPKEEQSQLSEEASNHYIVNTNTGKFHYSDCSSVDQMKESNKWYYNGTRSYLISHGYVPCRRCDP